MRNGIGFKLGLLLATFGIASMGLVGYYSHVSSRASLLDNAQTNLLTATQVVSRNFQVTIEAVSGDARMLAGLPSAIRSLEGLGEASVQAEKSTLLATFKSLMSVRPEYFQVRLISADQCGLEQVRVDRDDDKLTQVSGSSLQEKAHFPYVFNTVRLGSGEVNVSDIRLNHEKGAHSGMDQPTVRVAAPIIGPDGAVKGLIMINLDLNSVFDRLRLDLPASYQVYLSNRWGDFLVHPDASQTFGFETGRRVLIQDSFPLVSDLIAGHKSGVVARVEEAESGNGGLVSAFVRLPFGDASAQRFVIMGLSRPLPEVVHAANQMGWNTVQIIGVLAALALALAAVVSRLVTGPLKSMVRAVGSFSRSQSISVLPSSRQDEIGLLARSLTRCRAPLLRTYAS
jgi:HAMP domain-containing protein